MCVVGSTVFTDGTTGATCVAIDMQIFSVVARAFITKSGGNPCCHFFRDVVGIARQFNCGREASGGNRIFEIKEVSLYERHDLLYLGNVSRHWFVATSRAISKEIATVVNQSAKVWFHSFENQQHVFLRCK